MMYSTLPGFLLIGPLSCFGGVVIYAYYHSIHCDPVRAGYLTNVNQVRPTFYSVLCYTMLCYAILFYHILFYYYIIFYSICSVIFLPLFSFFYLFYRLFYSNLFSGKTTILLLAQSILF